MATVCVGCGLAVVGGQLVLDNPVMTGYVDYSTTLRRDATELGTIAPHASTGPTSNFGIIETELEVIELENESCKALTCMIVAHGRTRLDMSTAETDPSPANELRNEIRVNGGTWQMTDHTAYAQSGAVSSQEWNGSRAIQPVVVPAGGTLTIDRRCGFRWETNRIAHVIYVNMPSISVIGF